MGGLFSFNYKEASACANGVSLTDTHVRRLHRTPSDRLYRECSEVNATKTLEVETSHYNLPPLLHDCSTTSLFCFAL